MPARQYRARYHLSAHACFASTRASLTSFTADIRRGMPPRIAYFRPCAHTDIMARTPFTRRAGLSGQCRCTPITTKVADFRLIVPFFDARHYLLLYRFLYAKMMMPAEAPRSRRALHADEQHTILVFAAQARMTRLYRLLDEILSTAGEHSHRACANYGFDDATPLSSFTVPHAITPQFSRRRREACRPYHAAWRSMILTLHCLFYFLFDDTVITPARALIMLAFAPLRH